VKWAEIGVLFPAKMKILLFVVPSRLALRPTQPSVQWAKGDHALGMQQLGRAVNHSPPSRAYGSEKLDLYLHSPLHHSCLRAQLV
jgi:hypothetical protein